MFEIKDVLETTRMITENNLDVRTITSRAGTGNGTRRAHY